MAQNSQPTVSFWLQIAEFFKDYVLYPLANITLVNVFDILILAFLLYIVYKFIRDRHAAKTVIGLSLLILLYILSDIFDMVAINSILQNFYTVGIIALVVLFQPELREVLEEFGETTSSNLKKITQRPTSDDEKTLALVEEICAATDDLASKKVGALIVIENGESLDGQLFQGTRIDAIVSRQLLCNIFVDKSPLHDGAVLIRDGRIEQASLKSVTIAQKVPGYPGIGTRHRAAYKLCEMGNAVIVVVSEETGHISVAHKKVLKRGYQDIDGKAKEYNLRDDLFLMLTGKPIADIDVAPDRVKGGKHHDRKLGKKGKQQGADVEKGGDEEV